MKNILSLLLFPIFLSAQNLDSLFNELIIKNNKNFKIQSGVLALESNQPDKCAFGLNATIKNHYNEFDISQRETIDEVFERPELETSIVSPSGKFRIHYDRTGTNRPQYDNLSVEEGAYEVAVAFDSAYNFEVNILEYPKPPEDNIDGGDELYDVYILELGGVLYGATTPENVVQNGEQIPKYYSYIEIDNSFNSNEGYNTFGINAARVTAAHEYHHAVQLGDYGFFKDDIFYHELTSTAFEEFVYDEVNDYYSYLNSYFRYTTNRLENNSGYNLPIWNIFLTENYFEEDPMLGHKIVKRSWEYLPNNRAVVAIEKAMKYYGKSFASEFNTFGDWLVFTGDNSQAGKYFEESANYPNVRSTFTYELDQTKKSISIESQPTSINYVTFLGYGDTIVTVLSNSDVYGATSSGNNVDVNLTISNGAFEGANSINGIYYSSVSSNKGVIIQDSYIINNELSPSEVVRNELDYPYPQPFNYESYESVNFPTYLDYDNLAELKVFSTDMDLVFSGYAVIKSDPNIVAKWDGRDNNGNKLASGVYIYVTRADGKIKKGKFVVLN